MRDIVQHYRERGFQTAIDDFGAGYAGLKLLADIQTDIVKLDMSLLRHIDRDKKRKPLSKECCKFVRSWPLFPLPRASNRTRN